MQQLSGQDASFIYSERPHAPTHITSIGIYDQSTAPDGAVTFKGILARLEACLHLARAFRQKVVRVPGDFDHPWWVEDAEFDLEYHVRHIALPRPGDWRQFCIQAARLHSRPLDLSRPLWELSTKAGVNALTVPGRSTRLAGRLVPGLGRALQVQRKQSSGQLTGLAPATRFNGTVTAHRVLDARFYDFDDLKPMRHAVPGATVNDVALSVLGGALRQYLLDAGELPEASLRAMTPVSVRTEEEKGAMGNQVSAMLVSLATDVADPVERLAAVHASTTASKEVTEAIGARSLTDLSQLAPGALIGLGSRLAGQFARRDRGGVVNTVVTNVPGPREPLYFAGAEMLHMFGAGPVVDGMGLINIVGSYERQFVLSFTADRGMMPDPARYAACIDGSFDALAAAT